MISDNYTDIEAESLASLGYRVCEMGDLREGDEAAFKEKATLGTEDFEGSRILFFTVRNLRGHETTYDGEPTGNHVIRFIAQFERFEKPMTYGSSWACYRKEQTA